jgi:hypothetical protein
MQRAGFFIAYGQSDIGKKTAIVESLPSATVSLITPQAGKVSITLQQVQEASSGFHLRSGADREYLIIDDAHCLTEYAQNYLLKNLEELPGHVTVIMVTHMPHMLLATVQSRGFFVHLPAPGADEVREWIEAADIAAEHRAMLWEVVGNKPAALNRYIQDEALLETKSQQHQYFEQLCMGPLYERLRAATQLQPATGAVLDNVAHFARVRLRQEGGQWAQVVRLVEHGQRLAAANCNKKTILDVIAMGSTS